MRLNRIKSVGFSADKLMSPKMPYQWTQNPVNGVCASNPVPGTGASDLRSAEFLIKYK